MLHTPPRDLAWGPVGGFGLPSLPSPSASSTRSRKPACVCRVFYRESACHASASEIGRCAWFAGISDIPCQSQQVPISTFMTCHSISPTIARPDVSLSESTNSAMSLPNRSRPVIRVGKLMRHGLLCHYTCGGKEQQNAHQWPLLHARMPHPGSSRASTHRNVRRLSVCQQLPVGHPTGPCLYGLRHGWLETAAGTCVCMGGRREEGLASLSETNGSSAVADDERLKGLGFWISIVEETGARRKATRRHDYIAG